MYNATINEIKQTNSRFATLPEFSSEINLERVLLEEFNQELASDINNGF